MLKLRNITKYYQRGDIHYSVLKEINLDVNKGELIAIVGASGSGKSTLMNILGMLDRANLGEYFFDGEEITQLSDMSLALIRNQKIGFVFQSFFLLPRLTALQNVMLPISYRRDQTYDANAAKERALFYLAKMQVDHLSHHRPNQLSGGQQQRVAIARALINNPDLILADEPTGALDSQTSQEVMHLLQQLHKTEGRTIILITHDKEISRHCPRILTMKDGKLIDRMDA